MILKHAILHILDQDAHQLILSQNEMNLDQVNLHDYLEKQILKFNASDYQTGQLNGDDYLAQVLDDNNSSTFIEKTSQLAQKLFSIISDITAVPGSDLLISEYSEDEHDYFALFKLNFTPRFAHMVDYEDDILSNKLIVNQAILPNAGTVPDEGLIVDLMDGSVRLIEKHFQHNGQRIAYFAEQFAQLSPNPSVKNELQGLKQAVKHVADKFDMPLHETLANTQEIIYENVSDQGIVSPEKIGEVLFDQNFSAKEVYQEALESRAINHDIKIDNPLKYQKKYATQKFVLDSGIQISIPIEAYQDKNQVELINNPDGKITLMIKGIDDIKNKFNA